MKHRLNKARVLLEVWFAHMSAYRAEIIIWMLTGSIPLIMLAVWIGKATTAGGNIDGYTAQTFTAYFLGAWVTQQFLAAWVGWELDFQIRMGELSPKLLRPFDVFWEHMAAHVTEKVVRLPFVVAIVVVGLLLVPGAQLAPDVWHVAAYVLSASLAFLMRFMIAYCIGLLAFWINQAIAIDELYFTIAAFLTGSFAPLDLYPPAARAIIELLPFPYLVYYPVRILNGASDSAEIARVLGVQLAWVAVFGALRLALWRRGLRRYGAVGA